MGKRYGRNKRRKHREEMKVLTESLCHYKWKARIAESKARDAKQNALKYFMENSGLMGEAVNRISYELGRAVGEELKPHAIKIYEASMKQRHDLPLSFSIEESFSERAVDVLRGEIKPIIYNIALM